ncbi:MAG: GNAT family N-acetyltransferase [Gammaproteobacteria bacterium]|nr:GNAT family N-acetyltransferase [Gammaproteobacteria bacterium]
MTESTKIKWQWFEFDQLTAKQLDEMYQLRQEVFVVEQNCPYQDADGKDQYAHHLLGFIDDKIVATLRFFPEYADYDNHASLGRVCNHDSLRGQGIGKALMEQAIIYANENFPDKSIQIGAQSYLEKFYNDFGFERISEEYLEDDIPHILMLKRI